MPEYGQPCVGLLNLMSLLKKRFCNAPPLEISLQLHGGKTLLGVNYERMTQPRIGVLLVTISACFCFPPSLQAQTFDSRTRETPYQSWTAITDSNNDNLKPTRTTETHVQDGNRTLDQRSVQIGGSDRRFEPYQDVEKETLQVDATTLRCTTRTFGQDANGMKALVQVTEEETHIGPGGDTNVIRVTSNPDVNGRFQPVQREIVQTKEIGTNTEETNTTVMLPSAYGGLAPAFKTHELRKRAGNDTVETEKTTWLPDVNGEWKVSERRQGTARLNADQRKTEERVFRPDAEGKLVEVSRVVTREAEDGSGEKRERMEMYSVDVPGVTRDGTLHLVERTTAAQRTSATGEQVGEKQVEQLDPGDPGSGLRVSVLVDGRMVPGPSGEQSTLTIRARDSNGDLRAIMVDTTKSDKVPASGIEQTPK